MEFQRQYNISVGVFKHLHVATSSISNLYILLQLSYTCDYNSDLVFQHNQKTSPQKQNQEIKNQNKVSPKDHAHGALYCYQLHDVLDTLLVRIPKTKWFK
jgi:hypothetical protein